MKVTITNKLKHYIKEYNWGESMCGLIGNSYDIDMNKLYKLGSATRWELSYREKDRPKLYYITFNHISYVIPRDCFVTKAEKIAEILK